MIDMTKAEIGSFWVTRGDHLYGADVVEIIGINGDDQWMLKIRETQDKQWQDEIFVCWKATGRVTSCEHAWDIMHEYSFSECPY
jgi:hypothetical protein